MKSYTNYSQLKESWNSGLHLQEQEEAHLFTPLRRRINITALPNLQPSCSTWNNYLGWIQGSD
jgi:hypothetical protein